jgi:uncharacterized protein YjbI with pentapeptide repeats
MTFVAQAFAFDPAHLERFKATGVCPGCDLSDADLSDYDRPKDMKLDLRGADLSGATLDTADLSGALLRGADLSGATGSFLRLAGADLSGADLSGFSACYDQDFSRAVLRGANLRGARLCATLWHLADLAGADLSSADLTHDIGLTQAQVDHACGDAATKFGGNDLKVASCPPAAPQ